MKTADKIITIATGRNVSDTKVINKEISLSELFKQLSSPILRNEKDGRYYVYGKINGTRNDNNIEKMYCACIDIDDSKLSFNAVKRKIPNFSYHLHTTFSHKELGKGNRYRIVFPYLKPLSKDDHVNAVKYLANTMGLPDIDSSSFKVSQPFYLPACPRKRERYFKSHQSLDAELFTLTPEMAWEANQDDTREPTGYEIKDEVYQGDRDIELTKFVGQLVHYNNPPNLIEQIAGLYNTRFSPPLKLNDIKRVIRSITKAQNKNDKDYNNYVYVRPIDKVFNVINKTKMPVAAFARGKYDNVDSLIKSKKLVEVDDTKYMPSEGVIFEQHGIKYANTYIPANIEPIKGLPKVRPMVDHFKYLIPNRNERKILLWFIAYLVQFPGRKVRWMPIIKGGKGIGKSLIVDLIIEPILGYHNVAPLKASLLVNSDFNGHIAGKILHCIHEIDDENVKQKEKIVTQLKELISDDTYQNHSKGSEAQKTTNTTNFIGFTNKEDIIVITPDERRFVMIKSEATPKEPRYYQDLAEWLKDHESIRHIYTFFLNKTLSDDISPNVLPVTAYTLEIKDSSKSPLHNILIDIIEDYQNHDIAVVAQKLLIERVQDSLRDQGVFPTPQEVSTALKSINGFIHDRKVRISIGRNKYVPAVLPNKIFKPELYYRDANLKSEMRDQINKQITLDKKRNVENDFQ